MTSEIEASIVFNEKERQEEKSTHGTGQDIPNLLPKEIYSNPKYAKPTPEELETLKQQIIDGDSEARIKLYKHHLRYMMKIARNKAKGDPELVKDLFSDGSMGCYEASQKWDPTRDGPFLPYVRKSILRVMRAGLRKSSRFKKLSFKPKQGRGGENNKSGDKSPSQSGSKEGEGENKVTQTIVILDGIELDEIYYRREVSAYPRDRFWKARALTRVLEDLLRMRAKVIKNPRHRRFFVKYLDCDHHVEFEFVLRYRGLQNMLPAYARKHLYWYIPFLKKEFGKQDEHWPESQILKKFNNTLNYILRRYFWKMVNFDDEIIRKFENCPYSIYSGKIYRSDKSF